MKVIFSIFILILTFTKSNGLLCYKCKNVEGNYYDCIRSSTKCNPNQDACISHVIYTTPTYWTQSTERRAFVSKGCTTKAQCDYQQRVTKERCTYDMDQDWSCIECCESDNCNYAVKNIGHILNIDNPFKLLISGSIIYFLASCCLFH